MSSGRCGRWTLARTGARLALLLAILDELDPGLIHRHVARELHDRRRRLDVHRASRERAQLATKIDQLATCVRVLFAERDGVEAGDVELIPVVDHPAAHERDVEITGSGSVGVELGAILPAVAG